jgi:hypothetical protein
MSALQNLIKQINPNVVAFQAFKNNPKFYAHFDPTSLKIISINGKSSIENLGSIELDYEIAQKLLSGKEDLSKWIVGVKNDKPTLERIDSVDSFFINRVELNPIIKLDFKSTEEYDDEAEAAKKRKQALNDALAIKRKKIESLISRASRPNFMPNDYWHDHMLVQRAEQVTEDNYDSIFDLIIKINRDAGTASFIYNGDIILTKEKILRFYFTREDDPSHLKCVLKLDKNTLDNVLKINNLDKWPNPLTFKIPFGADDLSIYTIKSDLEIIVLEEK